MSAADGSDAEWRFAKETIRQRAEGWSLREQLLWRIGELTNSQSIDLAAHAEHFPEVLDAFTLNRITPVLVDRGDEGELISKASLEDGGMLRLTGFLQEGGNLVGHFMRRLQLEKGWAIHERLVLTPRYRAQGIGARFVHRSLELYDALGLELVSLQAGLQTGRWYWAQLGFDFAVPTEVGPVRDWARQACEALGIEVEGLDEFSSAAHFARLSDDRDVCFHDLAAVLPEHETKLIDVARGNGFAMTAEMPLGKAIMLSGPQWNGRLRLDGAQRRSFEAAVAERSAKARERAEAVLRDADTAETKIDGAEVAPAMEE
jgi:GNAT superfamily N-acetyltransferase